jgi:hypothetical protein
VALRYLLGILPALLILWVRRGLEEPEAWRRAGSTADQRRGSFGELLGTARWCGRTVAGVLLAGVGLATFWSITIAGQDLAKTFALADGRSSTDAAQFAKFAYSLVQATGGGLGLVMFGPLCQWIGRKRAFALAHLLAILVVPLACYLPQTSGQLLLILPLYGALTMGMHAGYAIYFPELFPTRLRALGTSLCFNGGRIVAAAMLPFAGWVKGREGMSLPLALTCLSATYLLGLVVLQFLPETKDRPLPE